jgi:hypothetical protein
MHERAVLPAGSLVTLDATLVSRQFAAATDRVSGEVMRIDVNFDGSEVAQPIG